MSVLSGNGIFRSCEPFAAMMRVVILWPSGADADIKTWVPSGDHRGPLLPGSVMRC